MPLEFQPDNVFQSRKKLDAELKMISVKTAPLNQRIGDVNWFVVENVIGDQFQQTSTGTGVPVTRQWEAALNDVLSQSLMFKDSSTRKVSLLVEVQKIEMIGLVSIDYDVAAKYRIMDRETGTDIYSKTIQSIGTAEPGEAFVGSVRARIAFVRAVKANIAKFLSDFQSTL